MKNFIEKNYPLSVKHKKESIEIFMLGASKVMIHISYRIRKQLFYLSNLKINI